VSYSPWSPVIGAWYLHVIRRLYVIHRECVSLPPSGQRRDWNTSRELLSAGGIHVQVRPLILGASGHLTAISDVFAVSYIYASRLLNAQSDSDTTVRMHA
jgi:hypothetical protein